MNRQRGSKNGSKIFRSCMGRNTHVHSEETWKRMANQDHHGMTTHTTLSRGITGEPVPRETSWTSGASTLTTR